MSKYNLEEKIGKGVYGDVYKGRHKQSNQLVAIKKEKRHNRHQGISSVAIREISVLKTIQNANIVELVDVEVIDGSMRIIMNYYPKDLETLLQTEKQYDAKKLILGILRGVEACHKNKCIHRDLKPQNILIDDNDEVRIGDFGMARFFQKIPHNFTQNVITLQQTSRTLTRKQLIFNSCRCLVDRMYLCLNIYQEVLFPGITEIDQLRKINDQFYITQDQNQRLQQLEDPAKQEQLNQKITKLIQDEIAAQLLIKMLQLNPKQRISCTEALQHKFFENCTIQIQTEQLDQDKLLKKYMN